MTGRSVWLHRFPDQHPADRVRAMFREVRRRQPGWSYEGQKFPIAIVDRDDGTATFVFVDLEAPPIRARLARHHAARHRDARQELGH